MAWSRAHVLHGPGAFYALAEDYERATRAKLRCEPEAPVISERAAGGPHGQR